MFDTSGDKGMTHRERVLNTIERKPVDYPASWLGIPTKDALPGLFEYFGANDLFTVDIPYESPVSNHIAFAFDFTSQGQKDTSERTLTAPGYFADVLRVKDIDSFPWPDPKKNIVPAECLRRVEEVPEDYAVMVAAWSIHYEATSAAFGMETALIKMMTEPKIYQGVMRRILDFYLEANEIFYRAVGNKIDVVLIGNDLGTQRGLLIGPDEIRKHVLPGTRELVKQAHSYGYKVMHHSCGAIADIIPDLIDAGVDVIHPIQALAAGWMPRIFSSMGVRLR